MAEQRTRRLPPVLRAPGAPAGAGPRRRARRRTRLRRGVGQPRRPCDPGRPGGGRALRVELGEGGGPQPRRVRPHLVARHRGAVLFRVARRPRGDPPVARDQRPGGRRHRRHRRPQHPDDRPLGERRLGRGVVLRLGVPRAAAAPDRSLPGRPLLAGGAAPGPLVDACPRRSGAACPRRSRPLRPLRLGAGLPRRPGRRGAVLGCRLRRCPPPRVVVGRRARLAAPRRRGPDLLRPLPVALRRVRDPGHDAPRYPRAARPDPDRVRGGVRRLGRLVLRDRTTVPPPEGPPARPGAVAQRQRCRIVGP